MKNIFIITVVLGLVFASGAWAMRPTAVANLETPGTSRTLTLPAAAGNSSVISLGSALDPGTGEIVEGFAIVRYRDNHAKGGNGKGNGGGGGKPGGGGGGAVCYAYLGNGAAWQTSEPWVVNPSNIDGLDEAFIFANLSEDIAKWEDAADGVVDGIEGADILGTGSSTSDVLVADMVAPDGVNEVYFADIDSPGAIGVTIVWGIFSGRPSNRRLVEWDQVYDDVDFDWANDGSANAMDFENIATHELGHSVGMSDLYDAACATETMYGYAAEGDIDKRDLEAGDIAGIDGLY